MRLRCVVSLTAVEIPRRAGMAMQTYEQLDEPLSGGCVRQATEDAIITWNWAHIGTVVVVVA